MEAYLGLVLFLVFICAVSATYYAVELTGPGRHTRDERRSARIAGFTATVVIVVCLGLFFDWMLRQPGGPLGKGPRTEWAEPVR